MTIPVCTYRLQLNPDFPLERVAALLPYWQRLGIDTLYLSPIWRARPGSQHGYDVVDPGRVNPELGGGAAAHRLLDGLHARGMGALLDIVPNHMAASWHNPWWADVLRRGRESPHAAFFDIDWDFNSAYPGKLLLPFLGQPFGRELEAGAIGLEADADGFFATYGGERFPLAPKTWRPFIALAMAGAQAGRRELLALWRALAQPGPEPAERYAALVKRHPQWLERMRTAVLRFGRAKSSAQKQARLEKLLANQPWRLATFRLAHQSGNYRRFFDINELVALNMEDPVVFDRHHAALLDIAAHPAVRGVRVDHVDGLYDPGAYLRQLSSRLGPESAYVVVEKILGPGEALPPQWPVAGTTGYDFLNDVMETMLDPEGLVRLQAFYTPWHGSKAGPELVAAGKRQVLTDAFAAVQFGLCRDFARIAAADRMGHDLIPSDIRAVIANLTVVLPVYRTYIDANHIPDGDRRLLEQALDRIRRRHPERGDAINMLGRVLFSGDDPALNGPERSQRLDWTQRWQQSTGPIQAKGFEDTALYRYHRLTCLNEVGGHLFSRGLGPDAFHRKMAARLKTLPHTMNATSTHDTKRSEDVRARIGVLSELSERWRDRVNRWHTLVSFLKPTVGELAVPDPATEYFIFQTMVGAWPLDSDKIPDFRVRLGAYLQKAVREAKIYSRWDPPNTAYEEALLEFVDGLFAHPDFIADFTAFQEVVARYGAVSSLAQLLLKALAPGVPDFYQGTELWDLSMTDPDNRRPVDFDRRAALLDDLIQTRPAVGDLFDAWRDGRIKLHFTHRALTLRSSRRELFLNGGYLPLAVKGARAEHVLAFGRRLGDDWCLCIVPRLFGRLDEATPGADPKTRWEDTRVELPADAPVRWKNRLSDRNLAIAPDRCIALAEAFSEIPFAVLTPTR